MLQKYYVLFQLSVAIIYAYKCFDSIILIKILFSRDLSSYFMFCSPPHESHKRLLWDLCWQIDIIIQHRSFTEGLPLCYQLQT